jgi:hypothetical protein
MRFPHKLDMHQRRVAGFDRAGSAAQMAAPVVSASDDLPT